MKFTIFLTTLLLLCSFSAGAAPAKISWKTPVGWKSKPASGMRYGSFTAGSAGTVDISVIFMGGGAGGGLPNVNRWRRQISLSPWGEIEFQKNRQQVKSGLGEMTLVDLYSAPKQQERIVAAFVRYKQGTWFFKMRGKYGSVEKQKMAFKKFLTTVK